MVSKLQGLVLALLPRRAINLLTRAKSAVVLRLAGRRFGPFVAELHGDDADGELLMGTHDSALYRVRSASGETTILKLADQELSAQRLDTEAIALDELGAMAGSSEWRNLIAAVEGRGRSGSVTWFSQTNLPGQPLSAVAMDHTRLVAAACAALSPIHAATSVTAPVDDELVGRLVTVPLQVIERWCPQLADGLAIIDGALTARLDGRELCLSRLHGDFAPTNILWHDDQVSGIVDWNLGEALQPPEIDFAHLALALLIRRSGAEYGDTVNRLHDEGPSSADGALVASAVDAGPNGLDLGLGLDLAWLHHVSFGLEKATELRENPIWISSNIANVVDAMRARA